MSEAAAQIGLKPREEKLLALIAGIAAPHAGSYLFGVLTSFAFLTGDWDIVTSTTTWTSADWFTFSLAVLGAAIVGWTLRWRRDLLNWAMIGYAVAQPGYSLVYYLASWATIPLRSLGDPIDVPLSTTGGYIVLALLPSLIILGAFIAGAWLRANRK